MDQQLASETMGQGMRRPITRGRLVDCLPDPAYPVVFEDIA